MTSDSRIPRPLPPPPAREVPSKADLRRQLLAARRALAPATRAAWDQQIAERVLDWCQAHQFEQLGVYWPLQGEPDLRPAYAELARRGVQLLLPVVLARDTALEFAEWNIGEDMVKDPMGVAIPAQLRMAPDYPAALLVPCLGYNQENYRLGYGGGYYDRTLARTPRPATLGIAYACQQADFATTTHDIPLDAITTNTRGQV